MTTSSAEPTRDRILDAAMRLFGERGFQGTSVTQIEAAAGLSPGSGGIYHHFKSKESLLAAGIDRHLDRLGALRDVRRLFTGIGDIRAELTVMARYVLSVLDSEGELLRILISESRLRPHLVEHAADRLVNTTYAEFAGWLAEATGLEAERARQITAVGLGALLSSRLIRTLPGTQNALPTDEVFVATWVDMMTNAIEPRT